MESRPNLFLVGAPKCGTTSLYKYLEAHPQIYMSAEKEPHFFGTDLVDRYGTQDRQAYEALFYGAENRRYRGEASVWYLYSERAAVEIREYNPDARIVIMLREPAEMMYSLHSQRIYSGNEDILDFEEALAAEPDRAQGRRIPPGAHLTRGLLYRKVASYSDQVRRYFEVFGRDRVHVIIYDDFRADAQAAYLDLLAFLELEPDSRSEFGAHNIRKKPPRSLLLNRVIRKPAPALRWLLHLALPEERRKAIAKKMVSLNAAEEKRPPLDPKLRERLRKEFVAEVERLESLLARDLADWKA